MKLKDYRLQSGLKASKIAEMLGIARSTLWRYENQKCKPNDKKIEKLYEIYGISNGGAVNERNC